ncbi:putative mind kinetochore complex component nnf1 protein [Neofusicoccum parvum UCRNP2]|uniref:Putative mind kinetochore complex component nnf1 protein n=1 Tax=Botryosphaeria parva (strain UCR-NP2) TaxID=1287680 RepID=R1EYP6_BOTPV|nr:putative mind kinetochore complex component nnf1 protein [Neofusicoccum parvum UCRNP2]
MPSAVNGDQNGKASSRSPSPAPAPPVAESPGPRAAALERIFAQALDATVKRCSYANFAACFPTPAHYVPENLDAFWRDFTGRVGDAATANFNQILAARNVVQSLNSLDTLVQDAKKRKEQAEAKANGGPIEPPTPPHTLPAQTLTLAHLQPFLSAQTQTLEFQLSKTQQANTQLLSEIEAQRAELAALVNGLEHVVRDLEGSVEMLSQDDVQNLTREVLDIDKDLTG